MFIFILYHVSHKCKSIHYIIQCAYLYIQRVKKKTSSCIIQNKETISSPQQIDLSKLFLLAVISFVHQKRLASGKTQASAKRKRPATPLSGAGEGAAGRRHWNSAYIDALQAREMFSVQVTRCRSFLQIPRDGRSSWKICLAMFKDRLKLIEKDSTLGLPSELLSASGALQNSTSNDIKQYHIMMLQATNFIDLWISMYCFYHSTTHCYPRLHVKLLGLSWRLQQPPSAAWNAKRSRPTKTNFVANAMHQHLRSRRPRIGGIVVDGLFLYSKFHHNHPWYYIIIYIDTQISQLQWVLVTHENRSGEM